MIDIVGDLILLRVMFLSRLFVSWKHESYASIKSSKNKTSLAIAKRVPYKSWKLFGDIKRGEEPASFFIRDENQSYSCNIRKQLTGEKIETCR